MDKSTEANAAREDDLIMEEDQQQATEEPTELVRPPSRRERTVDVDELTESAASFSSRETSISSRASRGTSISSRAPLVNDDSRTSLDDSTASILRDEKMTIAYPSGRPRPQRNNGGSSISSLSRAAATATEPSSLVRDDTSVSATADRLALSLVEEEGEDSGRSCPAKSAVAYPKGQPATIPGITTAGRGLRHNLPSALPGSSKPPRGNTAGSRHSIPPGSAASRNIVPSVRGLSANKKMQTTNQTVTSGRDGAGTQTPVFLPPDAEQDEKRHLHFFDAASRMTSSSQSSLAASTSSGFQRPSVPCSGRLTPFQQAASPTAVSVSDRGLSSNKKTSSSQPDPQEPPKDDDGQSRADVSVSTVMSSASRRDAKLAKFCSSSETSMNTSTPKIRGLGQTKFGRPEQASSPMPVVPMPSPSTPQEQTLPGSLMPAVSMPMPMPSPSTPQEQTLPGCLHVDGTGAVVSGGTADEGYESQGESIYLSGEEPDVPVIIFDQGDGLAVAELVNEPSDRALLELPTAQEMDPTMQSKKRESSILWMVGGPLLILLTIVVVLAAVLTGKEGTPSITPSQTMAPSAMDPTEERLWSLLPDYTQQAIVATNQSAQALAYEFLLNDRALSNYTDDRIRQRFALATFYHSTGGSEWQKKDHWISTDVHECDWWSRNSLFAPRDDGADIALDADGVTFGRQYSNTCGANGVYQNLWQWGNGLQGHLPPELFWLSSLRSISIAPKLAEYNVAELTDTRDLYISGPIPYQIGLATNLEVFSLPNNLMTGSLPTEIGLTQLKYIGLSQNSLNGTLPTEIGGLMSLLALDLFWNNQISGSIPWSVISSMTDLSILNLARNSFNGAAFPDSFGSFTNLKTLRLSSNHLTGSIPTTIGQLLMAQTLAADDNYLHGTLPTEIGLLSSNLIFLRLGQNELSGSLPNFIHHLTNMERFMLFRNKFTGTLPSEIGLLSQLRDLPLFTNELTGTIPTQVGEISGLGALWLYGNSMTGTLPSELGLLSNMLNIDLANNHFGGALPSELGLLSGMDEKLVLDSNLFAGTIPTELGLLSNLTEMYLDNNKLSGPIPSEIGLVRNVTTLSMTTNSLTSAIPSEIGRMTALEYLNLGDNPHLTGNLPEEFVGMLLQRKDAIKELNVCSTGVSGPGDFRHLCSGEGVCLPWC